MKINRYVVAILIAVCSIIAVVTIRRESRNAEKLEEVSPVVPAVKPAGPPDRLDARKDLPSRAKEMAATNALLRHKFAQWSEFRERGLTNAAFQAWVRDYMVTATSKIVSNVPIYGLSAPFSTNGVNVFGQIWGDEQDPQFTLETKDFTRVLFDSGAIRKIEVLTQLPSGLFDPRLSPEQHDQSRSSLDWAPDKNWSDEEVVSAFKAVASQFGITESDLARTAKPDRVKADKKRAIQPLNGPPIPKLETGGGDAQIMVDLTSSPNSRESLFQVTFRTEKLPDGTFRLAVVEMINNNRTAIDSTVNGPMIVKRFF